MTTTPPRRKLMRGHHLDNRFEVGDPYCGVIAHAPTWFQAYKFAVAHTECSAVTIFDRLAHPGRPDTWQDGLTIHVRPQAQ